MDASDLTELDESLWCRKPGQVWCPELGRLRWEAWWWNCWGKWEWGCSSESESWRELWQVWWSALREVWWLPPVQVWWGEAADGWWMLGSDLSVLWRQSCSSLFGPGKCTLEQGCTSRAEGLFSSFSLDGLLWLWRGAAVGGDSFVACISSCQKKESQMNFTFL